MGVGPTVARTLSGPEGLVPQGVSGRGAREALPGGLVGRQPLPYWLPLAQNEVTARSRIARTLGLCRPARGTCLPTVYKPADSSLALMRADIGAAALSLFGDPYELDPSDRYWTPAGAA